MPLTDNQLLEILSEQGISEILDIRRTEHIDRDRAALNKMDVHTKNNKVFALLEKNTISESEPYENMMYKYFFTKNVSIPKIYYNNYDQPKHEGVLLMEDLTPTHFNISDWEVPMESNKLMTIIEMISQFHAVSWGVEELYVPRHLESLEEYLMHIGYLERDYLHFRKYQTFNLREDQFEIYEKSLFDLRKNAQKHIERIHNNQNITYIHGDLNVCNILCPLVSNLKPYIIDLEAVRVGLCTEDLVMLFIHDLFHGGEETLRIFNLYYDSICGQISSEYTYNQFVEDIRISLMEGIFFPLKLFVHNGVKDEELVLKSIDAYMTLIGGLHESRCDN